MKENRYIKITYPKRIRQKKVLSSCLVELDMRNFVNLNIKVRSNSSIFLKFLELNYGIFLNQNVQRYYKRNFSIDRDVTIDAIFGKENQNNFLTGFADIERHIKCLLWDRFVILHASCVRYNGLNLFFMGSGESGKSTICSAMYSYGGRVLSDDYSLVEIATGRPHIFPTLIGSVRSGIKSEFQKKYLVPLKKYKNTYFASSMLTMRKSELNAFLLYHKKMYGISRSLTAGWIKKPQNIFIILKNSGRRQKNNILLPKNSSYAIPELIKNIALNPKYCNGLVRKTLGVFLNSRYYVLHRAPLDLMTSAIYRTVKPSTRGI